MALILGKAPDISQALARSVLSLFGPGAAPTLACNLFAGKQRTAAGRVSSLALIQGAIGAVLTCRIFREFCFVHLGGIGFVAQRNSLRIRFQQHGWRLRACQVSNGKRASAYNGLNDENSTI